METDAKNASVNAIVDDLLLLNAFTGFPLRNIIGEPIGPFGNTTTFLYQNR